MWSVPRPFCKQYELYRRRVYSSQRLGDSRSYVYISIHIDTISYTDIRACTSSKKSSCSCRTKGCYGSPSRESAARPLLRRPAHQFPAERPGRAFRELLPQRAPACQAPGAACGASSLGEQAAPSALVGCAQQRSRDAHPVAHNLLRGAPRRRSWIVERRGPPSTRGRADDGYASRHVPASGPWAARA